MRRIDENLQLASRVIALITDAYDGDTLTIAADSWLVVVAYSWLVVVALDREKKIDTSFLLADHASHGDFVIGRFSGI